MEYLVVIDMDIFSFFLDVVRTKVRQVIVVTSNNKEMPQLLLPGEKKVNEDHEMVERSQQLRKYG